MKVLKTSTKNFRDLSFKHKKYLDEGGFENVTDHLKWNGQKYTNEEIFVSNSTSSQSINDELKEELINKAKDFHNAYKSYNGEKVLDLVTQSSIDNHFKYRDYALYTDSKELVKKSIFDIIMTLSIRALFSKNEIIDLRKEEFFLLQYDKEKKIGEVNRPSNSIKYENYKRINSNSISIDAKDLASGESSPIYFVKEDGKWKVDLAKDYEFRREYYNKQLTNRIDKKELIRTVVNQLEGTNEKLLEPLINQ